MAEIAMQCVKHECRREPFFQIAWTRRSDEQHRCCDDHLELAKDVAAAFGEALVVRISAEALARGKGPSTR